MAVSLSSSDVVSQIASKLLAAFGERIPTVYKDTPLQGMTKPCFFIQQLNTVHIKEMNTRGERQYFMDIRAHPSDDEDSKFTWCNTIGHELFDILENIEISQQPVKAFSMRFEIKDEVLHFFVQYSFKVKKLLPQQPKMNSLEIYGTLPQKPIIVNGDVLGTYYTGKIISKAPISISINGQIINEDNINLSLISKDTYLWEGIQTNDNVDVLLSPEGKCFIIGAQNVDRTIKSVDGGKF